MEPNSFGFNMPDKKPHPIAKEVSKKIKDASMGRHAKPKRSLFEQASERISSTFVRAEKKQFRAKKAGDARRDSKATTGSILLGQGKSSSGKVASEGKSPSTTNELIPLSEVHSAPLKDAGTGTIDAVSPDDEKRRTRIMVATGAILAAVVIALVVLFASGIFVLKPIDGAAVNESPSALELSFGGADASAEQGYTTVSDDTSAVFTANDVLSVANPSLTKKIKVQNTQLLEAEGVAKNADIDSATYAYELYVRYTDSTRSYLSDAQSAADFVKVTVNGSPLSVYSEEYIAEVGESEGGSIANADKISDFMMDTEKINKESSFEDALNNNATLYQGVLAPGEADEIEITFTLDQTNQGQFSFASEFPSFDIVLIGEQQAPTASGQPSASEGNNEVAQGADVVFDKTNLTDLRKTDSVMGGELDEGETEINASSAGQVNFTVTVRSEQELLATLKKPHHTVFIPEDCAIEVNQDLPILHDVIITGGGTLVFNRVENSSAEQNQPDSKAEAGQNLDTSEGQNLNTQGVQEGRFATFMLANMSYGKPTLCITGGMFIHVNPAEYYEPNNSQSATYSFLPSGYEIEQQSQDSFKVVAQG